MRRAHVISPKMHKHALLEVIHPRKRDYSEVARSHLQKHYMSLVRLDRKVL